jgi:protein-disulfide isomerase
MPALGIAYFAAMIALSLGGASRRRTRRVLALAGGAWALGLIGLQAFVIGAWCKLCMIADPAAVGVAIAVAAGARTLRVSWRSVALAVPAAAAVPLALALGLAGHAPATVETPVARDMPAMVERAQVPGTVTIVELVDFECPFCREEAPAVADAIARAHVPVTVVRKMVPLAMHAHARTAALAWCCADAQGHGDAMAAALFAAPADELNPGRCVDLAVAAGCDRARYRAALADPATMRRVAADIADAKAAGVRQLPTVFVGAHRFAGAGHDADELLAAIQQARA